MSCSDMVLPGQSSPSLNLTEDLQKRLVEAQVRITKGKLSSLISSSNGSYNMDECLPCIQSLIKIKCDLALKYRVVPIASILRETEEKETLSRVIQAFSILEKYGKNLLRPASVRPPMWRSVMFANGVFSDKVDWMVGGREILHSYGYTVQIPDGVSYPAEVEPDPGRVAAVTSDIIMGREEIQLYVEGRHPHPDVIEEHLPAPSRVLHGLPHNAFDSICDTIESEAFSPRVPVEPVEERNPGKYPAVVQNVSQNANPLSPFSEPVAIPPPAVPVMKPLVPNSPSAGDVVCCDICGHENTLFNCEDCDNKVLCTGCDEKWHKHPKRSLHQRKATNAKTDEIPNAAMGSTQRSELRAAEKQQKTSSDPEGASQSQVIRVIPGKGKSSVPRNQLPNLPIFDRTLTNTTNSTVSNDSSEARTLSSKMDLQSQMRNVGIHMQSGGHNQMQVRNTAAFLRSQSTPQQVQADPRRTAVQPAPPGGTQMKQPSIQEILRIPNFELKRIKLEALVISTTTDMKQIEENLQLIITHEQNFLDNALYRELADKKSSLLRDLQIYESYSKMFEEEEKVRRLIQESQDDALFQKSIRPPPGDFYIPPTAKALHSTLGREGMGALAPASLPLTSHMFEHPQAPAAHFLPQTARQQIFESSPWQIATNVLGVNAEYKGACPKCSKVTNYYNDVCHHCKQEIPIEIKLEVLPSPRPMTPGNDSPARLVKSPSYVQQESSAQIGEGARPKISTPAAPRTPPSGAAPAAPPSVATPVAPPVPGPSTPPTSIPRDNQKGEPQITTLRRNQSSESKFGVHPKRWRCQHCTYENDAMTRVCLICDKTSDNPEYVEDGENVTDDDKLSNPSGDFTSPRNIAVNFQQDAEQMAKEKQRAREEFKRMMEEEEKGKTGVSAGAGAGAAAGAGPGAAAVSEVADGGEGHDAAGATDDVDARFGRLTSDSSPRKERLNEKVTDVNINKETAKVNKEFQKRLGDLAAKKKQEENIVMSRETIRLIRLAENQGYTFDELDISLKQTNSADPMAWLHETWHELIGRLVSLVPNSTEDNFYGQVSESEARRALVEMDGELEKAIDKCLVERKEKIKELRNLSNCSPEEASEALANNNGDMDDALEYLTMSKLKEISERLWLVNDNVTSSFTSSAVSSSSSSSRSFQFKNLDPVVEAAIMNRDLPFERRARLVLVEGKMQGWGRAENVLKVLDQISEELDVTVKDVMDAVSNCGNVGDSLRYLMQECELCYATTPVSKMMSLPLCQCKMCIDCVKSYFEVQVKERHVRDMVCPVCSLPDMQDETQVETHFQFISVLLRSLISPVLNDLFLDKLRDRKLMQDPNFRWCSHCECGFIFNSEEGQLKMRCPDCNKHTCFECKKPWERQHEGLSCEAFATWKNLNDPQHQAAGLAKHLEENGIDCPACNFRYALAKGGCMHFKCTQCRHEFCSGCYEPFKRGEHCQKLRGCAKAGLHCHHPRDCLFYLRDFEVERLQKLLRDNRVELDTDPRVAEEGGEGAAGEAPRCPVMEQKELPTGLKDEACGKDVPDGHAGLCMLHYKEYLVYLINKNNIDPVVIMNVDELKIQCNRFEKNIPNRKQRKESAEQYRQKLIQHIQREIQLPVRRTFEE